MTQIGDPRILRRYYRHQEAAADAQAAARRLLETGDPAPTTTTRILSRLGDEKQLRGIPAIGRGVQGHIPGTRP